MVVAYRVVAAVGSLWLEMFCFFLRSEGLYCVKVHAIIRWGVCVQTSVRYMLDICDLCALLCIKKTRNAMADVTLIHERDRFFFVNN